MDKNKLKIYSSINDFAPLFGGLEYLFKGLQTTGIDGLELVVGLKSRWSVTKLLKLSQKYNLPIVTLHQPPWSGLGLYFDEQFIVLAEKFGIKDIVFHPLSGTSLTSKRMQAYFEKLASMQQKYNIQVLLENLPADYSISIVNTLFSPRKGTTDIRSLREVAKKYNFKLNYDTSHLMLAQPHKEPWFPDVLPFIANIHLSSFNKKKSHLPLMMGDFKTKEFIQFLHKKNYSGKITFEIYQPNIIIPFSYNFSSIKNSVDYLRSIQV